MYRQEYTGCIISIQNPCRLNANELTNNYENNELEAPLQLFV